MSVCLCWTSNIQKEKEMSACLFLSLLWSALGSAQNLSKLTLCRRMSVCLYKTSNTQNTQQTTNVCFFFLLWDLLKIFQNRIMERLMSFCVC